MSLHHHPPPPSSAAADHRAPPHIQQLLAAMRHRRDAALVRRHDEIATYWAEQCVAVAPNDVPDAHALATCLVNAGHTLRAISAVLPHATQSTACRVLLARALLRLDRLDEALEVTDDARFGSGIPLVDPVPVLPGEISRRAALWTVRGSVHLWRHESALARDCFVRAVRTDPAAVDALRALADFRLLSPAEEARLLESLHVADVLPGAGEHGGEVAELLFRLILPHSAAAAAAGEPPSPKQPAADSEEDDPILATCSKLEYPYRLADSPAVVLARAAHATRHGAHPLALHTLSPLLAVDPYSPAALVAYIDAARASRDVHSLFTLATTLAEAAPDRLVMQAIEGVDRAGGGGPLPDVADALRTVSTAELPMGVPGVHTTSRTVLAAYALASYHVAAGRDDLARRALEVATTVDRMFYPAWLVYANSLITPGGAVVDPAAPPDNNMRAYELRMGSLGYAAHLAPNAPEPVLAQAQTAARYGHKALAIALYRRALELGSTNVVALGELGAALVEDHQVDEGLQLLRRAAKVCERLVHVLPATKAQILTGLARGHFAINDRQRALGYIQQALPVTLPPHRGPLYRLLGELHSAAGHWDAAVDAFHRALAITPAHPELLELLHHAITTKASPAGPADAPSQPGTARPHAAPIPPTVEPAFDGSPATSPPGYVDPSDANDDDACIRISSLLPSEDECVSFSTVLPGLLSNWPARPATALGDDFAPVDPAILARDRAEFEDMVQSTAHVVMADHAAVVDDTAAAAAVAGDGDARHSPAADVTGRLDPFAASTTAAETRDEPTITTHFTARLLGLAAAGAAVDHTASLPPPRQHPRTTPSSPTETINLPRRGGAAGAGGRGFHPYAAGPPPRRTRRQQLAPDAAGLSPSASPPPHVPRPAPPTAVFGAATDEHSNPFTDAAAGAVAASPTLNFGVNGFSGAAAAVDEDNTTAWLSRRMPQPAQRRGTDPTMTLMRFDQPAAMGAVDATGGSLGGAASLDNTASTASTITMTPALRGRRGRRAGLPVPEWPRASGTVEADEDGMEVEEEEEDNSMEHRLHARQGWARARFTADADEDQDEVMVHAEMEEGDE
ncbi:anaphase promoting complex subunit cdc16 [Blastocladiella emersonii ATCC 22665]|nr:anaphase promoting complex subunit cdc16 [Blastocladiella emersonii ATCC 22665]